jgi:hypothetical protein
MEQAARLLADKKEDHESTKLRKREIKTREFFVFSLFRVFAIRARLAGSTFNWPSAIGNGRWKTVEVAPARTPSPWGAQAKSRTPAHLYM